MQLSKTSLSTSRTKKLWKGNGLLKCMITVASHLKLGEADHLIDSVIARFLGSLIMPQVSCYNRSFLIALSFYL